MGCSPTALLAGGQLPVTSLTRPTSPRDLYNGLRIVEGDTGRELLYDGGGWVIMSEPAQAFTSVLKQNAAAVAATVTFASFKRADGWCDANYYATITAAGTIATEAKVTPTGLPSPLVSGGFNVLSNGTFQYLDQGTAYYVGIALWDNADVHFTVHNAGSRLGQAPSFAVAATDILSFTLRYQMATRYS